MQSARVIGSPPRIPNELIKILPPHLCEALCRSGAPAFEDLKLRSEHACAVSAHGRIYHTEAILSASEMSEILKKMCEGSLYAYRESITRGYLSLPSGIRVGVCGSASIENGRVIGVNNVTSLNVRIPHTVDVCTEPILDRFFAQPLPRGILLYAPPGGGKTTVLRALATALASPPHDLCTVVVDTREEMRALPRLPHLNLDILSGYPKGIGIEIALRSLGAQVILCDEVGDAEDANAILAAAGCGVPLFATAHAANAEELLCRPTMKKLFDARVFGFYVGLVREKDDRYSYQFSSYEDLIKRRSRGEE